MTPSKGQKVQVRFNNGIFFDAIVEEWSDQKSSLILPDSGEKVIIQKTLQDVLLVKIMSDTEEKKIDKFGEANVFLGHKGIHVPGIKPIIVDNTVSEEFEQLKEQPKNENNLKRMSELKDALNKLEREEVLKKATSFTASGAKHVGYSLPKNLAINNLQDLTVENEDDINIELSKLFDSNGN